MLSNKNSHNKIYKSITSNIKNIESIYNNEKTWIIRKWGRIEVFWSQNRGQNAGDFGTILPGKSLFGDNKVWLAVTL
jgi:hypothetical protein